MRAGPRCATFVWKLLVRTTSSVALTQESRECAPLDETANTFCVLQRVARQRLGLGDERGALGRVEQRLAEADARERRARRRLARERGRRGAPPEQRL